jgi:hypothetical protein
MEAPATTTFKKNDIIYSLNEEGLMYNKTYIPSFYKVIKVTNEKFHVKPLYGNVDTLSTTSRMPYNGTYADKIIEKQATPSIETGGNKKSFYYEIEGDRLIGKRLKNSRSYSYFHKYNDSPITWEDTIETFPR